MSEMRRRLLMTIANGGGGGGGTAKFASGAFTLTTGGIDPVTVEHGLGVVPNAIFVMTASSVNGSTACYKGGWHYDSFLGNAGLNNAYLATAYNNAFRGGSINSTTIKNIDEDYFDVEPPSAVGFPPNGATFYWFALYIDTTS